MAGIRTIHHLTRERTHARWDHSIPPLLTVQSGETVEFETKEASDNQVTPRSDVTAIEQLNFTYPSVDGAGLRRGLEAR